MSSIFLCHSNKNNLQALAIKQWLANNGWDDIFLDIDSDKGLYPGEQWKNALPAGKRRLNFANFTAKERVNFPAANHYHVDIIAHVNFMTGKLSADW